MCVCVCMCGWVGGGGCLVMTSISQGRVMGEGRRRCTLVKAEEKENGNEDCRNTQNFVTGDYVFHPPLYPMSLESVFVLLK